MERIKNGVTAGTLGFIVGWGFMRLAEYDGTLFTGLLCAAIGVWVAEAEW
jgi:hypothetical protein